MINILIDIKSNSLGKKKQIKTTKSSEDISICPEVMTLIDDLIIVLTVD